MTASVPPINTSANFPMLFSLTLSSLYFCAFFITFTYILPSIFVCIWNFIKLKNCRRRLAGSGEYFSGDLVIYFFKICKRVSKNSKKEEFCWRHFEYLLKDLSSVSANFVVHSEVWIPLQKIAFRFAYLTFHFSFFKKNFDNSLFNTYILTVA